MYKLNNPGTEEQTQPSSTSTRFQAAVAKAEDGWWYERPAYPLPRVWGTRLTVSRAPCPRQHLCSLERQLFPTSPC